MNNKKHKSITKELINVAIDRMTKDIQEVLVQVQPIKNKLENNEKITDHEFELFSRYTESYKGGYIKTLSEGDDDE